jgi:hypothetical protein
LRPYCPPVYPNLISLRFRSALPTEALEEFLSILRPSFFLPPSSPVLFTRRPGAISVPSFQHERSYSLKGRGLLQQKNDVVEELEVSRSTQPSRNTHTPDAETDDFDSNTLPVRWFTNVLCLCRSSISLGYYSTLNFLRQLPRFRACTLGTPSSATLPTLASHPQAQSPPSPFPRRPSPSRSPPPTK